MEKKNPSPQLVSQGERDPQASRCRSLIPSQTADGKAASTIPSKACSMIPLPIGASKQTNTWRSRERGKLGLLQMKRCVKEKMKGRDGDGSSFAWIRFCFISGFGIVVQSTYKCLYFDNLQRVSSPTRSSPVVLLAPKLTRARDKLAEWRFKFYYFQNDRDRQP